MGRQKLPVLPAHKIIKALEKAGFKISRQTGSHIFLVKTNKEKFGLPVPNHSEIGRGLLKRIIKQSRLTEEEFLELV